VNTPGHRFGKKVAIGLLAVSLLLAATYGIVAYGLPYGQWKRAQWKSEKLRALGDRLSAVTCAEGDAACLEKLTQESNKGIALQEEMLKLESPMLDVNKRPALIKALAHPDGTVCFLVDGPGAQPSDEELAKWLKAFGPERFYEQAQLFLKARKEFEKHYHGPEPLNVKLAAIARLKWESFPLGTTWRLYNAAERMIPLARAQEIPGRSEEAEPSPEELAPFLEILRTHGAFFTSENFVRLLNLAIPALPPQDRQP
jgi:hypothetical protein